MTFHFMQIKELYESKAYKDLRSALEESGIDGYPNTEFVPAMIEEVKNGTAPSEVIRDYFTMSDNERRMRWPTARFNSSDVYF